MSNISWEASRDNTSYWKTTTSRVRYLTNYEGSCAVSCSEAFLGKRGRCIKDRRIFSGLLLLQLGKTSPLYIKNDWDSSGSLLTMIASFPHFPSPLPSPFSPLRSHSSHSSPSSWQYGEPYDIVLVFSRMGRFPVTTEWAPVIHNNTMAYGIVFQVMCWHQFCKMIFFFCIARNHWLCCPVWAHCWPTGRCYDGRSEVSLVDISQRWEKWRYLGVLWHVPTLPKKVGMRFVILKLLFNHFQPSRRQHL